jgi:hypothetical protein
MNLSECMAYFPVLLPEGRKVNFRGLQEHESAEICTMISQHKYAISRYTSHTFPPLGFNLDK